MSLRGRHMSVPLAVASKIPLGLHTRFKMLIELPPIFWTGLLCNLGRS
jgi:hypothetical protein